MDLQQIRYFITLARELHFWHTAEKMYITQSALSRQIKSLEEELGVQLFERTKRSVKLTAAGAFLRDRWELLLDEIDQIHRQARKMHAGAYGALVMGYPGSIAYGFLPEVLARVAHSFPELKIELIEPTDIQLEQLLLQDKMDLAFRREPAQNPTLASVCLYSEPFSVVVPMAHPLQAHTFRGLEDLKAERFILSGLHHPTFYASCLRQLFQENQFEPDVYIESDFGAMILSLVAKGLGVTILPSSYAYSSLPGVRFIDLPQTISLYALWRKDNASPVVRNVLQQAQQLAETFRSQDRDSASAL
ncbi:DNA-binding transcriptional regulator, LysR family [Catalinimonas alkaloidigena]|uniref:DNA-binding transcriptional regulator, LysR family n=1 Tax=Catalinimonas alkaloidigena TaxID=1075417 RepID=A0A1G9TK96_9BACT|nr:LysR family transcriptional regulator [Catalinimonas alkaloidigena]SDM48090.1 DNA-binding transcriptional regulator, LysR family [Catalinimonas alkaloidigena]